MTLHLGPSPDPLDLFPGTCHALGPVEVADQDRPLLRQSVEGVTVPILLERAFLGLGTDHHPVAEDMTAKLGLRINYVEHQAAIPRIVHQLVAIQPQAFEVSALLGPALVDGTPDRTLVRAGLAAGFVQFDDPETEAAFLATVTTATLYEFGESHLRASTASSTQAWVITPQKSLGLDL
jgi:hypothetical protein